MTWAHPVLAAALLLELVAGAAPARAGSAPAPDPAAAAEAIAAGDAHYARRGEGADEQRALPFEIDGAIAEYRRALALDPASREARLRLMRADFFRGGFCGPMARDAQVALFDEAKRMAEETVATLDAELKRSKGRVPGRRGPRSRRPPRSTCGRRSRGASGPCSTGSRPRGRERPGASATWRRRSSRSTRRPSRPAPTSSSGGCTARRRGSSFVTGWVSREKAVAYVREGLALAPDNRALVYFTADVLLQHAPASEAEARALLERCATSPPRPDFLAEDLHYARMARERLAGSR